MERIFVVFFVFMICFECSAKIQRLRTLCIRETAFDFCGLRLSAVNSNAVGHTDRELESLIAVGRSHYEFRLRYQESLEALERAMLTSDTSVESRVIDDVCMQLDSLCDAACSDNSSWLLLNRSIERLFYSVARIISQNRLSENAYLRLIPKRFFIPPVRKIHSDYYGNLRQFRNLLLLAIRIRAFEMSFGCIPKELSQINTENLWSVPRHLQVIYEAKDDMWTIRYGGRDCDSSIGRFNVYIPTLKISELQKWPLSGCVCYSKDYDVKRMKLYCSSVINEEDDIWECRFVDGRIIRP